MEAAITFAETGHLCLATLHANNANQTIERVLNFFPPERAHEIRLQLSLNLRAIISQRLVRNREGELQPAVEILLNTSLIAELIKSGEFAQIKEAMEQSLYPGSQTFEQALCRLFLDGRITYDEAMTASDSATNLAWLINQNAPNTRVEAIQDNDDDAQARPRRGNVDFASVSIDPAMLDHAQ